MQRALIIFDIDGTLFRADLVTVPAVQRTFDSFGLPIPEASAIESFFGKPAEEYEGWLAAQCPEKQVAAVIEATNTLELALIGEEGALYPGVTDMLERLGAQGHTLAACSNGPDAYVDTFMDAHGVRSFFATVLARGTRYEGKASMVRCVMESISIRPVVMVGDRRDDVDAARRNGALAIGAAYGFGGAHEIEGSDHTAKSPSDIPDLIRQLLTVS